MGTSGFDRAPYHDEAQIALDVLRHMKQNPYGPQSVACLPNFQTLSALVFVNNLFRPAIAMRDVSDDWFGFLMEKGREIPSLLVPDHEVLKAALNTMGTPGYTHARTVMGLGLVHHIAGVAVQSDHLRHWWSGGDLDGIKSLTNRLYQKKSDPHSFDIFSSLLRHAVSIEGIRDHLGPLAYLYCVSRGLDVVSPITCRDPDKKIEGGLSVTFSLDPNELVSVDLSLSAVHVFFHYLHTNVFDADNPLGKNISALGDLAFKRSPDLADTVLRMAIHHGRHEIKPMTLRYFLGVLCGKDSAQALAPVCCAYASDQACVDLHDFLQRADVDVEPALAARVSKLRLDQALQDEAPINQKIKSPDHSKQSKI